MADTNIVTLAVGSYNAIKNDNFRYNLFLDNLLQEATPKTTSLLSSILRRWKTL